jgi:hypothetical protein
VPFLRRRQENEPDTPVPGVVPAAPESAEAAPAPAPASEAPLVGEYPQTAETPVESQFQPVEGADEMLDMPLGTLIFRAGLIAPQQLEDALAEGLRSGKRLGEVLLSRGWLSEDDLSRLLAGQKGLPYADLDKIAIDRELAQAMSYDDARSEMALPVVTEFGLPVVAMADPDEAAMDRLRAQLGPEIRFVVGAPSALTRLIEEVLGGAPAPGLLITPTAHEQFAPAEPSADYQVTPDEAPAAEASPAETAVEAEPAVPEPAALDASEQEAPAPSPDPPAQEMHPIIAEGEVDYPTFSQYQPLPEIEIISESGEQLPAEVQMGGFGYYDDPSLLEGNAWQAGESGPPAAKPASELTDIGANQPDLDRPAEEPGAPIEEVEAPVEYAEQPLEEAEAPAEYVEQPAEYAVPVEYAEQPLEEAEAPIEQAGEEPAAGAVPEPVASELEAPAPEPLEESADEPAGEDDPALTTPAWMRGELNVITADVADFIDSGASSAAESPLSPPVEDDAAEDESAPFLAADEPPVGAPLPEDATDLETAELAESDATAAELDAEPPAWASEPVEAVEEAELEGTVDVPPEPAPAATQDESAPKSSRGAFELVLRLVDGDRMPIGSFDTVEGAQEKAAEVVKQFAEIKEGGWPFIGGRFLRPETIVSIDVEQHGSGWGGSNSRGRMFSGGDGS